MNEPRSLLTGMFDAAIAAADPNQCISAHLPAKPKGRTVVIGAGKGAAQMAAALERLWDGALEGVVVTRYGFGEACRQIKVLEASHPVPDMNGLEASRKLLEAVSDLSTDDLVIALVCGGGSALLPAPADGLTFEDEVSLNEALLASGAPIQVMNAIRKHVSKIKGGRLAAAAFPAKVVSLIVSDIPGDDPAQVASGPTVADWSTREQALSYIHQFKLDLPANILNHLNSQDAECPKPDNPKLTGSQTVVIASNAVSLEAAASYARSNGIEAVILSDAVEGEAREVAKVHSAIAREIVLRDRPFKRPVVILSGGETTVTLSGNGKGGRNTEFLLSFACGIESDPNMNGAVSIHALAADTDGIDGSEDNAGAFADLTTIERMRSKGLDPVAMLSNNDAWTAFSAIGDLFVPGPTGTNVNDFRAVLIR
ncbi:MAG: glycerate kinase type-2 family protein [Rhizobiaceae bacterium]